jgi:hypothetical protein
MMENAIPVRVTGEGVRRLTDLHSVLHDLQWVQVACVLAIKHMAGKGNAIVVEALQTSALVRYCRTFESAPETRFSLALDMLETLPADLRQAHHEFCALRNQYIAHSGADLLWNVPMAHVEKDAATGSQQVSWVTVEHSGMAMPSRDSLVKLYDLVLRLLSIVQDGIEQENSSALAMMRTLKIPSPRAESAQHPAPGLTPTGI